MTNKLVKWEDSKATRIVRISVTDGNATDSSGDEKEESKRHHPRVKKHINEIRITSCGSDRAAEDAKKSSKVVSRQQVVKKNFKGSVFLCRGEKVSWCETKAMGEVGSRDQRPL